MKAMLCAAALAALPMSAGAATMVMPGSTYGGNGTIGPGESLSFDYTVNQRVQISLIAISGTGHSEEDLRDIVFGIGDLTGSFSTVTGSGLSWAALGFIDPFVTETNFTIAVADGVEDDVQITFSFSVSEAPPENPAQVPLPAAGFMLMAAIGGLGAFARYRRAA